MNDKFERRDDIEMMLIDKGFAKSEEYEDQDCFERFEMVVDYTYNNLEIEVNGTTILRYMKISDEEIYKILQGIK